MVSLFPQEDLEEGHGLRPDLAEMLDGAEAGVRAFPGRLLGRRRRHGAGMYRWKKTIGDLAERTPLWNIWGYYATHGLGYHEYLQMCEDLGRRAALRASTVGMSHKENRADGQDGRVGAGRAGRDRIRQRPGQQQVGRAARQDRPSRAVQPEVHGNRQRERRRRPTTSATPLFYDAIKAKYPEMQLVANEWSGVPKNRPRRHRRRALLQHPGVLHRQRRHSTTTTTATGRRSIVGEYAVTQGCGQGNLRAAVGEAAFMTGMERNSDVVVMASYAPLFVNVNHQRVEPRPHRLRQLARLRHPVATTCRRCSARTAATSCCRSRSTRPTVDAGAAKRARSASAPGARRPSSRTSRSRAAARRSSPAISPTARKGWRLLRRRLEGAGRRAAAERRWTDNVRAFAGDKNWTDYTYTLKARKLGGAEGFLILFHVKDEEAKAWWNIGGWGNTRHALEMGGDRRRRRAGQHRDRPLVRHPHRGQGRQRQVLPRRQADPRRQPAGDQAALRVASLATPATRSSSRW